MDYFSTIDRNAHFRMNQDKIDALINHKDSGFIFWHKGKVLLACMESKNTIFSQDSFKIQSNEFSFPIYLGKFEGRHYFSVHIDEWSESFKQYETQSLREISLFVDKNKLSLLFFSQGLLNWHQTHQFCGLCGSNTKVKSAGHSRLCKNNDCKKEQFPRIEPAVIFALINNSNEQEKLLLARQAHWDENRYSVIAGFVEHGESIEDAVRREGYEEAGLVIDQVVYQYSQPWPFPASLMLGFNAYTKESQFNLYDDELDLAKWFTADEVEIAIKNGELKLPFSVSISWKLIDDWFTALKGYSIKTVNHSLDK